MLNSVKQTKSFLIDFQNDPVRQTKFHQIFRGILFTVTFKSIKVSELKYDSILIKEGYKYFIFSPRELSFTLAVS